MLPADGGYQQMGGGGGGYGAGMPGGNDAHVSVGAGVVLGRDQIVGEQQIGPSTVTDTYTPVGKGGSMNKTPLFVCLGVVGLLICYMVAAGAASDVNLTAVSHRWRFEVHTQMFGVEHRGNWQRLIPFDSYNRMCSIRRSGGHYDTQNPIGRTCHNRQTTVTSQGPCSTSNGVQHCQTISTPVVQQVCNDVYQYYIDYDTWCDYNVNRWVDQTPAVSSGIGLAPFWPYVSISNCGMLGCTRLGRRQPAPALEQHYMVDFRIGSHSSTTMSTCDFSASQWNIQQPQMMWGWINDDAPYQGQATNFGTDVVCNSIQTRQAAPPPPDFQFVPDGGNSTAELPAPPADMVTAAPGPDYAPGGQLSGGVPAPAPAPPPPAAAFLAAAEEPEITELDVQ